MIQRGKVLLAQRPSKGLLGGMWEFPNGRVNGDPVAGLPKALKIGYNLRLRVTSHAPERTPGLRARTGPKGEQSRGARKPSELGIVQHGYSHFSVTVRVFACELIATPQETNLKWVSLNKLDEYPMGKIDRQIAKMITGK
jgi:A/G-specific adenine glycosylase